MPNIDKVKKGLNKLSGELTTVQLKDFDLAQTNYVLQGLMKKLLFTNVFVLLSLSVWNIYKDERL